MGATQSHEEPYILNTPRGSLRGVKQSDPSGKPICYRFLKIPYAQPPVGKLRWRRPQPMSSDFTFSTSDGGPGEHTSFGAICPQPVYAIGDALIANPNAGTVVHTQDEDCLFLNIWVPVGEAPKEGWPVQFDIHGGWLQVGKALQTFDDDPFDLLAHATPRIIASPTYRLNLFGFLAGAQLTDANEDSAPANYGLWDQRCAIEWVANNISLFGGNPKNITVGGLSAGANSTFYQLYYDSHQPEGKQLIKNAYFRSNAVAIQPPRCDSEPLTGQFDELCSVNDISLSLSRSEKLDALRSVPYGQLASSISKLKMHTFRVSTEDDFVPSDFLARIHDGQYTTLLAKHNVHVMVGETANERLLYKLINPPHDYSTLLTELNNYYPPNVVEALLPLYDIPRPSETDSDKWADIFSKIVGDMQVHASIRGFTRGLLTPDAAHADQPNQIHPVPPQNVHRFRIEWRAKALDDWIRPAVKVCHAADTPIWWASGWRAGYSQQDKEATLKWVKPFAQMMYGEKVEWGTTATDGTAAKDRIRVFRSDGSIEEHVKDELWDRGMEICDAVWNVQKGETTSSSSVEQKETGSVQNPIVQGLMDSFEKVKISLGVATLAGDNK